MEMSDSELLARAKECLAAIVAEQAKGAEADWTRIEPETRDAQEIALLLRARWAGVPDAFARLIGTELDLPDE
jgi:hypothetical protein